MNEATRDTVCLKKTSLGNLAEGATESPGDRAQGSKYASDHDCLKCPCPCTPLCCSVIYNRMHLPRLGNSSWVDRKADAKPLLIKKHFQLKWSYVLFVRKIGVWHTSREKILEESIFSPTWLKVSIILKFGRF